MPGEDPKTGAQRAFTMLPHVAFSTADVQQDLAFDAWRTHISAFFDIERDPAGSAAPPAERQTVAHLQTLLMGETAAAEQVFSRSGSRIAADGLDHFLVQVFLKGGGAMPDRSVAQSDMLVIDMGQPHLMLNHDFAHLTVVIPRNADPALTRILEQLHGAVLSQRNPQVRLLASHIIAVWDAMGDLTEAHAAVVSHGILGLMSLALSEEAEQRGDIRSDVAAALKHAITVYIEERLSRQVPVEELAHRFNISRSMLYRMFAAEGGLQSHVRARRLALAFRKLSDPRLDHLGIGEIAFACGFQSDAHFARLFREKFGSRASDVRNARQTRARTPGLADMPSRFLNETGRQRQLLEQWLAALP